MFARPLSIAFCFFLMLAGPSPAAEGGGIAGEREAVAAVIARQLEAFRRDDGAAAYAQAAPIARRRFPTVAIFMRMVRRGYAPLYRARNMHFGRLLRANGKILQEVTLTGPKGQRHLALYQMQRQPDGTWKISGVVLLAPREKEI
ncbi:MAG: DUF4864 domain-containing protein [Alphaproteobacteria bacterium]|nr:DUF4864 domain-containing protein [Alphaproteobacteria bacterium]